MELLHKAGFNVVVISIDNASANRKFYKDCLCNGSWKNSIKNSYAGGTIFLVFNLTHIIKNIYNNFLTKQIFKLPSLPPLVPNSLTANFSDVQPVYDNECDKPLKIAQKLSNTVLKAKTIEKVNAKLALSVLHDSTVIGLKQFNCSKTAATIELFIKFWSFVNVSDNTNEIYIRTQYNLQIIGKLNFWKVLNNISHFGQILRFVYCLFYFLLKLKNYNILSYVLNIVL